MKRLALTVTLGLAAMGCVRTVPFAQRKQAEEGKCELVRTLLREPVPARLLNDFHQAGYTGEPAPVLVYLRRPQESVLERFFEDSPACGDATFRVVQDAAVDAVVVYLESAAEGYTYDARRVGPEELTMGGSPQGLVRRNGEGWVTATP
jgi:hypothetical protein